MIVGLIGCGGIAHDGYLPALAYLQPELVCVWDVDAPAASRAARVLIERSVRASQSSALAELVQKVDRVVIAVPPAEVRSVVTAVAKVPTSKTPMPLLLEKPLGTSAEDARLIIEHDGDVDLHYMETFLHSTAYVAMLEEALSGRYGTPRRLVVAVKGSLPANLESSWRGDRKQGGGVLHDWGIHAIGLALHALRTIGLLKGNPGLEPVVGESCWERHGSRQILTHCELQIKGAPIEVSIQASWVGPATSPSNPDVLLECDGGSIGLHVRKTDGSSDWVCYDDPLGSPRQLASRRYPKELFIRGLAGFIGFANARPSTNGVYDPYLGVEAMRIADSAYAHAVAKIATRSD
ncbi:Gfo/Idh/MocA family oxidoreductase [Mycolicibacterium hippocampi]|uniref:Gfo/Idh/MocA-like oxidoreductase N-terminal domain-containing protein n=1 Tax=Mycolicibacterium hippocampi TaxID=659824 RepID=A0A850PKA0_9MYCO|nr:Gfo/Idh/MocA family oxidoreductase [Mycolicibacterium hippocampi]NVN49167.1 hypothetical protein [Mycolicibacterium hippocampi]